MTARCRIAGLAVGLCLLLHPAPARTATTRGVPTHPVLVEPLPAIPVAVTHPVWPAVVTLGPGKDALIGGRLLSRGDSAAFNWLPDREILTLNGLEIRCYRQPEPPARTPRETWLSRYRRAFRSDPDGTPGERALRSVRTAEAAWADSSRLAPPGSVSPSPLDTTFAPQFDRMTLRIKFVDQTYAELVDLGSLDRSVGETLASRYVANFRRLMGPAEPSPLVWLWGNFDYRFVPGETAREIIDLLRDASKHPLGKGDRQRALALKIDGLDLNAVDSLRVARGGRK